MPLLHTERVPADPTGGHPDGRHLPAPSPLVLLHGFTQTGRLWGDFGTALGRTRPVMQVDLPGHGGSSSVVEADLWATADSVVAAVAAAAGDSGGAAAAGDSGGAAAAGDSGGAAAGGDRGGAAAPFDLCGYSLGGRVALHVALAHPAAVRRLVLISATAGIEDDEARGARRRRDDATAAALESSGDVDAFLARWLAAPMFAGLRAGAADRAERRRNTAVGLASSLRHAGTGTQDPLWDRLGALSMPVLLLAGATDIRFVTIAVRLRGLLPRATLAVIPGAGHAAHLQQPALCARTVLAWLDPAGS